MTSPKAYPSKCEFTKAGNLKCTTRPAGNSTGWKVWFPGTSVGLCLFQTALLVFASYRHLNLSEGISTQSLEFTYTKRPSEYSQL